VTAPLVRPLEGEPLALDLLNTTWPVDGAWLDFLADPAGVRSFAAEHGTVLAGPQLAPAAEALVAGRTVVLAIVEGGWDGDVAADAQRVLDRAHIVVDAGAAAPSYRIEGADPAWTTAIAAVLDAVDLVTRVPDRIRQCAHPACVLWFLDTSRSGARRWCSMATCGNRTKARRHYQRARADAPAGGPG
jgi:predicted RNA-binding Zn ribbon-like protein